ncbi:MAG: zinc metalloprotease HtpX [Alkalispirochaeta sp.]
MTDRILRRKRLMLLQTIALAGVMLVLASRAVAVVFGAPAGWLAVGVIAVLAVRAATSQQLALPAGTERLDPYQAPQLYDTLQDLIHRAGLSRVPPIFILPSRGGEAMTTGVGDRSLILLSQGILTALSLRELRAVLAHEVSHIRNRDLPLFAVMGAMHQITHAVSGMLMVLLFLSFPAILFGGAMVPPVVLLYLGIVPIISLISQLALLRTREFQADLGSMELTQDPWALASALARLEGMHRRGLRMFGPGGTRRSRLAELLRTHPSTEERVRRLQEVAEQSGRR